MYTPGLSHKLKHEKPQILLKGDHWKISPLCAPLTRRCGKLSGWKRMSHILYPPCLPLTLASCKWKGPPKANRWPVGCVLCEGPRPRHNTTHHSAGHHSWVGMWPASDKALRVCVCVGEIQGHAWRDVSYRRAHRGPTWVFWISCDQAGYFVFKTGNSTMTSQSCSVL